MKLTVQNNETIKVCELIDVLKHSTAINFKKTVSYSYNI